MAHLLRRNPTEQESSQLIPTERESDQSMSKMMNEKKTFSYEEEFTWGAVSEEFDQEENLNVDEEENHTYHPEDNSNLEWNVCTATTQQILIGSAPVTIPVSVAIPAPVPVAVPAPANTV